MSLCTSSSCVPGVWGCRSRVSDRPCSEQVVPEPGCGRCRGQTARSWLIAHPRLAAMTEGGSHNLRTPEDGEMDTTAQHFPAATLWFVPALQPEAHLAGQHRASKGHRPEVNEGLLLSCSGLSSCGWVHGFSSSCSAPAAPSRPEPVALFLSLETPGPLCPQDTWL